MQAAYAFAGIIGYLASCIWFMDWMFKNIPDDVDNMTLADFVVAALLWPIFWVAIQMGVHRRRNLPQATYKRRSTDKRR